MRCIIAGSRDCEDYSLLCKALENCPFTDEITEIVSGGAKGVDKMGEKWGKANRKIITVFPAKWKETELPGAKVVDGPYGKYNALAGIWRNQEMADYADALIAIDLGTTGTDDMIRRAEKAGLSIFLWPPRKASALDTVYQF